MKKLERVSQIIDLEMVFNIRPHEVLLHDGDILVSVIDDLDFKKRRFLSYYTSTHWSDSVVGVNFDTRGTPSIGWPSGGQCDDATAGDIVRVMKVIWSDIEKRLEQTTTPS